MEASTGLLNVKIDGNWEEAKSSYVGTKEEYLEDCQILSSVFSKATELENIHRIDLLVQYSYDLHTLMTDSSHTHLKQFVLSTQFLSQFIIDLVKKYSPETVEKFAVRQQRNLERMQKLAGVFCSGYLEGNA